MPPALRRLTRFLTAHLDGVLLSSILLMMFAGLLVLLSASNGSLARTSGQLVNMLIALSVMWVFANIPPHFLQRLALPLFVLGCALLVAVALAGTAPTTSRPSIRPAVVKPTPTIRRALPLTGTA